MYSMYQPVNGVDNLAAQEQAVHVPSHAHHAGLETSVTRTPLASTLILSILAGSSTILVPCLASALVALYITLDFPFIMSQRDRSDMALKVSPHTQPGIAEGTLPAGTLTSSTLRLCIWILAWD